MTDTRPPGPVVDAGFDAADSGKPAQPQDPAPAEAAADGGEGACRTRISYGSAWMRPADHAARDWDEVEGVVTWNGSCESAAAGASQAVLSNGWRPHFMGRDTCAITLQYRECGELFANPVVEQDCPDPGVLRDDQYIMTCTSGGPAFPIRSSPDLVHWTARGSIFSASSRPQWATGDFWAPEIHRVDDHFVAYFSARHTDGDLAIGTARATAAFGPYRDSGAALVREELGAIDAHQFEAPDGARYLLWKVDGNASASPTPIKIQRLDPDGQALIGSPTTLLRNTLPWEGDVIEGPWLIFEAGYYYLFYSGNGFASDRYAVGVARSDDVMGPFTKAAAPIVVSAGPWAGPGHGSVVRSAAGAWVFVFHAWPADRVGQPAPGRQVLLTRIEWADGWPTMLGAPSSLPQPLP